MTGMTAKRNSVSGPKTANSCGLTLSAAIRRVMTAGDNPQAAIPETVIIGDRGLAIQGANFAQIPASELFTLLYIIKQNLRQDDHPNHQHQYAQHHANRRDEDYHAYYQC